VPAEEKIARLLGMLLIKDVEQKTEQVTFEFDRLIWPTLIV
jgi:hypothetical protein